MSTKNLKINSILNVIKTLSNIIFPIVTFPYVSRILQPENIGKVNFASSFVSYFSLIASLGITTYAIRECSAVRGEKNKLGEKASQIFSINVCTTIVAYVLLGVSLVFFRKLDSYRTLIIIQSMAILFTTWGADWLNSAMEDFKFITIRSIGFQFISLILMFILVHRPEDYFKYAAITVLSSCGANITNILYRRKYCTVRVIKDMHWQEHFKPILLLFVMILAQTIFNSADITMLGLMKGDHEVGLYSTAVKMSNLISQIVASLAWVVMPRMSLYFAKEDFVKINEMLKKTLNVLLTIGLPCAIGCICLSKEIVVIISGENYISSAPALSILMIGFIFSLIGGSFLGNMVLLPSKREDIYMIICCIATAINLAMNYFMIPRWGVNAAAATTAFASLLIMILLIIVRDKRVRMDYVIKTMIGPVVGCLMIIIICSSIKSIINDLYLKTIICGLASAIIYLGTQIILKNKLVLDVVSSFCKRLKR